MELTQLRYFITVAKKQHLTRAAEELMISQPALSKAISRLEEEVGTPLFDRTPNKILLNNSGKRFLEYVQTALNTIEAGTEAVRQEVGLIGGNVSIMTSCSGMLQSPIRTFITEHRDIQYQQFRYSAGQILSQLEDGTVDFAVTTQPSLLLQCTWRPLLRDELYVVTSPEHPFSQRDSITLEELSQESLIINNNLLSVHDIIVGAFEQHGLRPRIAYELNNPPLTEQLLQENRGIAFVPGMPVEQRSPANAQRKMIPVEEHPFSYELGILTLKNRYRRPAAELLEQFLVEWFSNPLHTVHSNSRTNVV